MFRVLQIDPDTLAIHINAEAISKHKYSDKIFGIFDLISQEGIAKTLALLTNLEDESQSTLVDFSTSYLHELRHYGDLLLSPHGFYRVLSSFELYTRFPKLLLNLSDKNICNDPKIPIPLATGSDHLNRQVFGIKNYEESFLEKVILTTLTRFSIINDQTTRVTYYKTAINKYPEFSGDQVLEALAYITQFQCLSDFFNNENINQNFKHFYEPYKGSDFDKTYRWFMPYMSLLGLEQESSGYNLMYTILFASLCGSIPRDFAKKLDNDFQPHPCTYLTQNITDKLPNNRFLNIILELQKRSLPPLEDKYEIFQTVDDVCKKIFGIRIEEEIRLDIQTNRDFILMLEGFKDFESFAPIYDAFSDILSCREKYFKIFQRDPLSMSSVSGFWKHAGENLKPSIIFNFPSGLTSDCENDLEKLSRVRRVWVNLTHREKTLHYPHSNNTYKEVFRYDFWAPMAGDNGYDTTIESDVLNVNKTTTFSKKRLTGREILYGQLKPLAQWLLDGSQHECMNPAVLDEIIKTHNLNPDQFVLDPCFMNAIKISTAESMFSFYKTEMMKCDLCLNEENMKNSFLVSAGTIRNHQQLRKYYIMKFGHQAVMRIETDWSPWLLCLSCIEDWKFPIPKGEI